MEDLINEVECIRKLDHPNILKIYEYFLDKDNFYICSELCEGGELFDYIVKKIVSERRKGGRDFLINFVSHKLLP